MAGQYSYTLKTTVSSDTHSGTDNDVEARLHGDAGITGWAELDKWYDDFWDGGHDTYTVDSNTNIGIPLCVEFRIDGSDALLLTSVRNFLLGFNSRFTCTAAYFTVISYSHILFCRQAW